MHVLMGIVCGQLSILGPHFWASTGICGQQAACLQFCSPPKVEHPMDDPIRYPRGIWACASGFLDGVLVRPALSATFTVK